MDKLKEMSEALTAAGRADHHIHAGIINIFKGSEPLPHYEVEFGWTKVSKERPGKHQFDTFAELYDFCMNIKPKSEILYRKFSL